MHTPGGIRTHGTNTNSPKLLASARAALFRGLALGLAAVAAASTASAADTVILILDPYGSMAGKINGERKIDIACKAADNIVWTMQPRNRAWRDGLWPSQQR